MLTQLFTGENMKSNQITGKFILLTGLNLLISVLSYGQYEDLETGKNGFGNTELFGLIIPNFSNWGTGRAGIGPLVTMPGNPDVSKDEWGYGLAAAIVNNSGKFFYGILFTQSWRAIDPNNLPAGDSDTNPLGIAPFLNYRIANGWYVQTADLVIQYDWDSGNIYVPIGARLGKVLVFEKSSINIYYEYRTSMVYKDWPGAAVEHSHRFNVSYTIPVGKKK